MYILFNIIINWYFWLIPFLKKNTLKAEMWSADLKKVFKGLKIVFENCADTNIFYGTIWNIIIFFWISPFLTVILVCFENVH